MRASLCLILLAACGSKDPAPAPAPAAKAAGDPPGLVFRDASGRTLTKDDLKTATGRVDWSVVGSEHVSEAATALFNQGREAGGAGDYAKAVAFLTKAHDAAPTWPYPLYELAYTYELMDQPTAALAAYEQVVALAPRGFFTALASVDCLRREAAKEWAVGLCKRYALVEFAEPSKRTAELQAIVAAAPGMAVAWKELALDIQDDAQRVAALDKALAAKPDPETRGLALSNKALALDRMGKHAEAVKILGELVLDPTSPLYVVEVSKLWLSQVTNP
ncbi:MAG: tetratricopeptide repeat protein [Polyangiales bacterium]